MMVAETPRLIIRKFTEADAAFIFNLLNSAGWLEFIGDRNIRTLEDARLYILNAPLFSYHKFGFGPYLIERKEDGVPIGMSSLIKRDTLIDVDLGFALLPEYSGKGYAQEASKAVMDYAYQTLGIKKLVAIANGSNVASIRLLTRLGFKPGDPITLPGENEALSFFSYSF